MGDDPFDPPAGGGDADALEADLRAALQHLGAEIERRDALARELEALVERARRLLEGPEAPAQDASGEPPREDV